MNSSPAGGIGQGDRPSQGLQGNVLYTLQGTLGQALHHNHALLAIHQLEACTQGMHQLRQLSPRCQSSGLLMVGWLYRVPSVVWMESGQSNLPQWLSYPAQHCKRQDLFNSSLGIHKPFKGVASDATKMK